MWTVNFQMFKLVLEKAEESEIKLPTSAGSWKRKRVPEKHLFLLYWLCQSLWLIYILFPIYYWAQWNKCKSTLQTGKINLSYMFLFSISLSFAFWHCVIRFMWASLPAQMVKSLPTGGSPVLCPQLPSVSFPTGLVDSGVTQTPKYLIKPRKQQVDRKSVV